MEESAETAQIYTRLPVCPTTIAFRLTVWLDILLLSVQGCLEEFVDHVPLTAFSVMRLDLASAIRINVRLATLY